jgi:outer membrane protein assembly factor BamB
MDVVNAKTVLFFAGGNGIFYGLRPFPKISGTADPETGVIAFLEPESKLLLPGRVFSFDFDPTAPKTNVHSYLSNRREGPSNFYAMPVFYRNRIYLAGGGDIWWGKNQAWLKCIDATKTGDVTTNALLWTYALQKHVLSTPAIAGGLLFIADCGRAFHCLDAETGQPLWTHDIKGEAWASPLVADGKVYLGTRSGDFYIFAAQKEKTLLSQLDLGNPISATATAANGVLYLATMNRLYALKDGAARN